MLFTSAEGDSTALLKLYYYYNEYRYLCALSLLLPPLLFSLPNPSLLPLCPFSSASTPLILTSQSFSPPFVPFLFCFHPSYSHFPILLSSLCALSLLLPPLLFSLPNPSLLPLCPFSSASTPLIPTSNPSLLPCFYFALNISKNSFYNTGNKVNNYNTVSILCTLTDLHFCFFSSFSSFSLLFTAYSIPW